MAIFKNFLLTTASNPISHLSLTAKILGHSKHTTAEELHQLIMTKKTTYAAIRKLDQGKFADLESTMRMLYDHGSVLVSDDDRQSADVESVASAEPANNKA